MPLVLMQKLCKVDLHLKNERVTFHSVVLALSVKPNQQLKNIFGKSLSESQQASFFVQKLGFFRKTMEQKKKQLLATNGTAHHRGILVFFTTPPVCPPFPRSRRTTRSSAYLPWLILLVCSFLSGADESSASGRWQYECLYAQEYSDINPHKVILRVRQSHVNSRLSSPYSK